MTKGAPIPKTCNGSPKRCLCLGLAIWGGLSYGGSAQGETQQILLGIHEAPYSEISEFAVHQIDFEEFAPQIIDQLLTVNGVIIGERFSGQTLRRKHDFLLAWHDILETRQPSLPLAVETGFPSSNLAIAWDDALQSHTLMPLGPDGQEPHRSLGTGSLAIRFSEPMCFFGFKVALDGVIDESQARFLGGRVVGGSRRFPEGSINLFFYSEAGTQIAEFRRYLNEGPIELGYAQMGTWDAQIGGVFIQNLDVYGIGIDDLIFDPVCPYRLF